MAVAVQLQLQDYGSALTAVNLTGSLPGEPTHRASIYALQSFAARRAGDIAAAIDLGKRALALSSTKARTLRGRASTDLGLAYLDQDPPDLARGSELLHDARALFEDELRDNPSEYVEAHLARAEHNLGFVRELAGDFEQALTHYQRALVMKRESGDLPYQISSERDTALMLLLLDRPDEAAPHQERLVALATEYSDPFALAFFDAMLGWHRLQQRRPTDARGPLRRSIEAFGAMGDDASLAKAQRWLDEAESMLGGSQDP